MHTVEQMVVSVASQESRQAFNLERLSGQLVGMLRDALTTDIVLNADGRLWRNQTGIGWSECGRFKATSARLLAQGVAKMRDIPLNHANPILETTFPLTQDRMEVLISPVVTDPVMAIRTRQKQLYKLAEHKANGVLTNKNDTRNKRRHVDAFLEKALECADHLEVIELAILFRRNILLVGPCGSGKTTFGNSIIAEWANVTPNDRVVIIEDTPELQCSLPNHVQLLSTAAISQGDLLVAAMRLIPKRIVVGEIREEAPARVLLNAWNTGHSGGLCTLHANDALAGLYKFEALIGGHSEAIRERIAAAINLVIFIEGDEDVPAGRKVREVMVIRGVSRETGEYLVDFV
jgi:Flp pilus assembly CpaF family ATPase